MRPLEHQFGISAVPLAAAHRDIVEQVLAAERGGLDLVGIQDHPYQRRFLDTFPLIADLLARTLRIRVFPDVANLPMRGPTMIAKAAADAVAGIVVDAIVDPTTPAVVDPPPDWGAMGLGGEDRPQ